MKTSFFTESILYWLARAVSFAAGRLPASLNTAVGAWVGELLYHALPGRRTMALRNLRAAFTPYHGIRGTGFTESFSPLEYRKILKEMFRNFGATFMEIARIPAIDRAYIDRWITIPPESVERVKTALAEGHGVIVLTAHFGNWELSSITAALHGYPALLLAREQGWPRLNRLLNRYRESKGCRVVTKGFPIRELIRGLQQGRMVGILSDQDGGRNGLLCPFFGRLASTAPGAIALGLDTQAPILPFFLVRRDGPAHTLIVEEPLAIPSEGALEERIQAGVAGYLKLLEQYVRRYPGQWLWLHRRWKSSPERRLLLLTDQKAGHQAQLKAFAQRLQTAWKIRNQTDRRLRGIRRPLVQIQTVPVVYRNRLGRFLVSLVASGVPKGFAGGEFWLRLGLTPESYSALRSAYADYSISCGAGTAAVNLLWAWGIGVKAIHITRPAWPSWRRFHLAVVPRHDLKAGGTGLRPVPRAPGNLLITDGALASLPGPVDVDQVDRWRERLGIRKSRQIGLLIGGPTRGVSLPPLQVEQVVRSLLKAAELLDAELLVTSSRRTPASVEDRMKELLGNHPRCRLLVLVNRQETGGLAESPEAIPCILGLAQGFVVSGDSISMISEALVTLKPMVSFHRDGNGFFRRATKHHRFLKEMERQGRLVVAEPERVGEAIAEAFRRAPGDRVGDRSKTCPQSDPIVDFLVRWL